VTTPDPELSRRQLLRLAASAAAAGAGAAALAPDDVVAAGRAAAGKHFVLVHGSWHGAWCWYKVTPALERAGHRATALELPSAGIDATPPSAVTLQDQAERVIAYLDALAAPVILVGHSAGGPVISMVAEARPQKIEKLVYLTAFLLPDGGSAAVIGIQDRDSLLAKHFVFRADGTVDVDRAAVPEIFYGGCDARDVALARSLLKPIGLRTTVDAVRVGAAFAGVRRFYITCLRDRAVSPAAQKAMYTALPCEAVLPIPSDHSPFFSQPAKLVRALHRIARA
jgi:pimeloyl-ACP methyl ester carboxylesterase